MCLVGWLRLGGSNLVLLSLPMSNGTVCRKEKGERWGWVGVRFCAFSRVSIGEWESRKARRENYKVDPEKKKAKRSRWEAFFLTVVSPWIFTCRGQFYIHRGLFFPLTLLQESSSQSRQFQLKSHPSRLTSLNNKPFCRKGAYRFFLR